MATARSTDFPPRPGPREEESLSSSVTHVLEEARLLIPGAQAFVGFQLVAVFSSRFKDELDRGDEPVRTRPDHHRPAHHSIQPKAPGRKRGPELPSSSAVSATR